MTLESGASSGPWRPLHEAAGAGGGPHGHGGAVPGLQPTVLVAPPKLEPQPWARNAWSWLVRNTTGVARVDLRRPTVPQADAYQGNLFIVRNTQAGPGPGAPAYSDYAQGGKPGKRVKQKGRVGGWRSTPPPPPPPQVVQTQYGAGGQGGWNQFVQGAVPGAPPYPYQPAGPQGPYYGTPAVQYPAGPQYGVPDQDMVPSGRQGGFIGPLFTGARVKVTRSFLVGAPRDAETGAPLKARQAGPPLLDMGIGVNLDIDGQALYPVARIKVLDIVSLKMWPYAHLKLSRSIPVGPLALKLRYEVPLNSRAMARPWSPPARLMLRLDSAAGSGVHLSPAGIDFDEQLLRLGDAVSVRGSASLLFPRQIPFDPETDGPRLQVHRLSLKSIW